MVVALIFDELFLPLGQPNHLKGGASRPPLRGITSGPYCERPLIAFTGLGREAALWGLSIDARLGKILEPANVEHCRVPHVLKRLPGQRRPTARAAVQEDRLVLLESGVVKLALRVSPELQHAPRDVHCTFDLPALDLPALLNLVWVADIDDHHVTGPDLLGRLGGR